MAAQKRTPRANVLFHGLKSFWKEFTRTKRGLIGGITIILFIIVSLIGPAFTTYDPLFPQWPGYYPAGPIPATLELCVPIWYRHLPGGDQLSENMEVVSDYKFTSSDAMNEWNRKVTNPNFASATYNSQKGSLNDGCIQISYNRQASDTVPEEGTAVTFLHDFTYPYKSYPKQFWIHFSYLIDGAIPSNLALSLSLSLLRRDTSPLANYTYPSSLITSEDSMIVYKYPLDTYKLTSDLTGWKHEWARSTKPEIFNDAKYYLNPGIKIFPKPGDYTFVLDVIFDDKGDTSRSLTVFLDNINILLYGNAFGLLGSDGVTGQPRDMFTALLHGAQISVMVGLLVATCSVAIGLVLGLIAGYFGSLTDEVIMRVADFLIGLPGLPLLIVLAVVLKPSVFNIVVILVFMGWMGFSRNIRSMTLSLRERAFVEAARASGSGRFRILFRHIMPNVFPLVYLALAVSVPGAIVAEASLSFLGLFDPTRITWGRMFNEFTRSGVALTKGFSEYWFWVLPPGIAISALAISFIMLGYSLDEILNPKFRRRR